jgi:monoamine oxidase
VSVTTKSGETFRAARAVVALPLGVLQAESAPRFEPALPQKTEALRGLEMGHVVKLAFAFEERIWADTVSDQLGFLFTAGQPYTAFWTGYPLYAPVLVAWAGGPAADALMRFSLAERADRALESLALVLGVSRADVDRRVVGWEGHDWAADPFARGAYSYVRVGGMAAQAAFAQPVAGTLFFAGEATELEGRQATVHGALFAGRRAADEVLRTL